MHKTLHFFLENPKTFSEEGAQLPHTNPTWPDLWRLDPLLFSSIQTLFGDLFNSEICRMDGFDWCYMASYADKGWTLTWLITVVGLLSSKICRLDDFHWYEMAKYADKRLIL